jgi:hypothetical protein
MVKAHWIFSVCLSLFVLTAAASPSSAQNGRDMINVFGAIMQSAIVQTTQAEWRKLGPASQSCVDETLRQRGLNLQTLVGNGITPSDSRVAAIVAGCRSQAEVQPYANVRLQPPADTIQPEGTRLAQPSKYRVDKIALGSIVAFDSTSYREYQCRPSDQFQGLTWCQKQKNERAARGEYLSSYSIMYDESGRLSYMNRYLEPAFFDPGETNEDIGRLSRAFGEQPRTVDMPQSMLNMTGVIASWGAVTLDPLDPDALSTLAAGRSPGGILIDYLGDFQQSIRLKLPVYRVGGGAGYVWAESHAVDGRGRLRFFAIDASSLSAAPGAKPKQDSPPPVAALDPWKECQSSNVESRLAGCTKVIETKGTDRVRLADALDGRCAALNEAQKYQSALTDCKAAIDSNPRYSYAYANLGTSYLGLNDAPNALISLNKAITLKSNFVWSRLGRAKALVAAGAPQEALKDYQYALLIDPSNQVAKDGIVSAAATEGASQQAQPCLLNPASGVQTAAIDTSPDRKVDGQISQLSELAQAYRDHLNQEQVKVDQLAREKSAAEKNQISFISADDRKKLLGDVQRSIEAVAESQSRYDEVNRRTNEQQERLQRPEVAGTAKSQPKDAQQSLTKLRAARADAERELNRTIAERDEAVSRAQQKAAELAARLMQVQKLDGAKENAEGCVRQIRAGLEALDEKASDLRGKQRASLALIARRDAGNLLADLASFAQRNATLVPLEAGPLVVALKDALAGKDDDKTVTAFDILRNRLDAVAEFKRFRLSNEEARQRVVQGELEQLEDTARTIAEFIAAYVRANITSDSAQDLLRLRKSMLDALATSDTSSLQTEIPKSEGEFERLHVASDYRDYRAKHPIKSRKNLPATTDRNRYLLDGPLDETLILVNESGRSGVVRNLRGELVFDGGRAALCFAHDNNLDGFALSELKRKIIDRGATTVNVLATACAKEDLDKYDLVAVSRGLFATVSADLAASILTAADKGEMSLLDSVSDRDLQLARNGDSIKSLQLENDLFGKAVEGYGIVVVANGTSIVCQTVAISQPAHEALLRRSDDRLQLELGSPPSVLSTTIDSAFVAAKRGQCGAIYGAAKDLKDLISSLQRDKKNYHVLPVWYSAADVDTEQTKVAESVARGLREQQAIKQKKIDDQIRIDNVRKQTDAERREREAQLRQENGVLARGMSDSVLSRVKAFTTGSGDTGRVAQEWPGLARWFRARTSEGWELESVNGDLLDYGIVEWKNRVLEAGFVAIRLKTKNRALGEYHEKCFSVGYAADREFNVERDPIDVPCEDEDSVGRYKVAHSFSSKWFAH